jgi:prolyl-tRNA synthetase
MALEGDPCPKCKAPLALVHGIEVGHVFKLGTKYSVSLAAEFLDEKEQRHPMIMGCYGIGINRIVAGLAETSFDENGLIWPLSIAPYEVLVIPLNVTDPETMQLAERFYKELGEAGVDVLMDDRDARAGFKFKDADLIGIPLRIVIWGRARDLKKVRSSSNGEMPPRRSRPRLTRRLRLFGKCWLTVGPRKPRECRPEMYFRLSSLTRAPIGRAQRENGQSHVGLIQRGSDLS